MKMRPDPDTGSAGVKKRVRTQRNRTVYSCETCRERKVKCNREYPCDQCVKAGSPANCVFVQKVSRPSSSIQTPGASEPTPDGAAITSASGLSSAPESRSAHFERNAEDQRQRYNFSLCRGKDFNTRYYSRSHTVGLLSEFVSLKDYPQISREIQTEFGALRLELERTQMHQRSQRQRELLSLYARLSEPDYLCSLLPNLQSLEELFRIYTSEFETMDRILHPPVYRKKVNSHFTSGKAPSSLYTAQLLLVCKIAASRSDRGSEQFTGESTPVRDEAVRAIRFVDVWLRCNYPKRPTVEMLQVKCLMISLRRIYGIDVAQIFASTAEVVMLAKTMGMHRDPTTWKKMTPYTAEIRRRLWYTIVEQHILAAIERGMTPCVAEHECDCRIPANVDDDQLYEDMLEPPQSHPSDVFTSSTLQSLLVQSQSLRLTLVHRINGLRWDMTQKEAMELEHKIIDYRSTLQNTVQALSSNITDNHAGSYNSYLSPSQSIAQLPTSLSSFVTLIQLQLRQLSLLLLQPFILSVNSQSSRFERRACLEIASDIIETAVELHEIHGPGGGLALAPISMVVRSALFICQETIRAANSPNRPTPYTLMQRQAALLAAIGLLRARLFTVGRGMHDIAILSVALGYMEHRAKITEDNPDNDTTVTTFKPLMDSLERVRGVVNALLAQQVTVNQNNPGFMKGHTEATSDIRGISNGSSNGKANQTMYSPNAISYPSPAEAYPSLRMQESSNSENNTRQLLPFPAAVQNFETDFDIGALIGLEEWNWIPDAGWGQEENPFGT